MQIYLNSIIWALALFPLVVLILCIHYMIIQYHKYGAITKKKFFIMFSFIFYLLCVYFLVILPLPKIKDVALYQGKWYNLKLFDFIKEIQGSSSFILTKPSTYISLFTTNRIVEPISNIVLMIPFGIYLRYYFKKGWFTTIIYTLLFSLFLEITQLTGLYYIYPRPYRMFDVNDLLTNTIGGLIGFILTPIFSNLLPTVLELDEEVLRKGKNVSFSRRAIGYLIDIFLINLILLLFKNHLNYLIILIVIISYFIFDNLIFKGKTIGKMVVNIKIKQKSYLKYILRSILFEGLFMHNYLILLIFNVSPLIAILIQIACYFFLIFNIICEKYYGRNSLLIDKILKLEIVDTIKHEETYIIRL